MSSINTERRTSRCELQFVSDRFDCLCQCLTIEFTMTSRFETKNRSPESSLFHKSAIGLLHFSVALFSRPLRLLLSQRKRVLLKFEGTNKVISRHCIQRPSHTRLQTADSDVSNKVISGHCIQRPSHKRLQTADSDVSLSPTDRTH